jgi:hypothetical protein
MIDRIKLLQRIFGHFQQAIQWLPNDPDSYLEYINKAESIIELLEIEDCGSVGGFDEKNPLQNIYDFDLYDRFVCLVNKYKNINDIKNICDFTVEKIGIYFNKVSVLYADAQGLHK